MDTAQQLATIDQGFTIVASFPKWSHTPIVLGESASERCAACSAQENPQDAYRNGKLYASQTGPRPPTPSHRDPLRRASAGHPRNSTPARRNPALDTAIFAPYK